MGVQKEQSIESLVEALREQTEANKHLANSIAMLASALAEQVDEEPVMDTYLDGSRAQ